MSFTKIQPQQITDNVFNLIGKDWMLVTAGSGEKFNTMTASWGGLGIMWATPVAVCVVRPSRHTYGFMEQNEWFTLSFYGEEHRDKLNFCGANSGRNVDKAKVTGLTPVVWHAPSGDETVYFEQARLVLACRKLYCQDIDPKLFLDPGIEKNYNGRDYHRVYTAEIAECLMESK